MLGLFEGTHLGVISAERTSSHNPDNGTWDKHIRTRQALSKGFMLLILLGATQVGKSGWGLLSHTGRFLVSHLSSVHIKNLRLMM